MIGGEGHGGVVLSDAVGGFGRGVRRNWSQRQTKFGRKSHFLSALEPARGGFGCGSRQNSVGKSVFCLLCGPQVLDLDAGVDKIRQKGVVFVYFVVRRRWIWVRE